ncbi:hypothetical protein AALP_AA5G201400 [Arabis alpina]|uniref:Methyltransferase n=1 Tax=Arabis alpina TaxID=50452 RepID=A0A087GY99_ARAAL|nr:hypothetical protein AALP_AA5G201400 [Arabis alpina]
MTNNNIFQSRKFSGLCVLSILLVSVTIILLTNDTIDLFPYLSLSYLRRSSLSVVPSFTPISTPTNDSSSPPPPPEPVTQTGDVHDPTPIVQDSELDWFKNDKEWNQSLRVDWKRCESQDYMPCLDNTKAIKKLKSKRNMEHRERHCPESPPKCLVPLPKRYKIPLPWPQSKDMIWYDNVPHPKLVEYKKDQNWVRKNGPFFVFPGGGTQFKDGVIHYINFIQKTLPVLEWGKKVRVVLDVGCGVASFGGTLLDKNVITMSFAPKDEHEAQIQFALERGIPATLAVIGTQKLPFPDNAYDVIHCARCRVHWHGYGGRPLLELNRILRPGGFFVWSATPVYQHDQGHRNVWKTMEALTNSMCWKVVARTRFTKVGFVIYQKPNSDSCYESRKKQEPPLCNQEETKKNSSWYTPLLTCLPKVPVGSTERWPSRWPERLTDTPVSYLAEQTSEERFREDTKLWSRTISETYLNGLATNWTKIHNVMDMNAGYGGFAAALINRPLWVMNVIPVQGVDTLPMIFDRGLIGIYHDWCESFNTYPRSYDLLHSSFLLTNLSQRCDLMEVVVEIDRIVRPGGYLVVQDTVEMLKKLNPILLSLRWSTNVYKGKFLVGLKSSWRP